MATKAQKMQVGIFLIVGLALIIIVFAIISIKRTEPTITYYIKFQESVSGLGKDSNVLYQGVPVGKVRNVRVTEKNEIIARIEVARDRVKLRKGTVAQLGMGNLMGGMQVELSGGEPDAPQLTPHSYIPSKLSVLKNLTQDLPKILEDISSILAKLDKTMGVVKGGRLGALVRNTDDAVQELTYTMKLLQEAIVEAQRTFTKLGENPSSIFWGGVKPKHPYVK